MLSKEVAAKLEQFKVQRFQVSRRILRMNKKLEDEFGEHAAEQKDWHWALTTFVAEAYGKSKRDVDKDQIGF